MELWSEPMIENAWKSIAYQMQSVMIVIAVDFRVDLDDSGDDDDDNDDGDDGGEYGRLL